MFFQVSIRNLSFRKFFFVFCFCFCFLFFFKQVPKKIKNFTVGFEKLNKLKNFDASAISKVFINSAIFITLLGSYAKILSIIFFECMMFCWSFTLTLIFLFIPFSTITFSSTVTRNMFYWCSCLMCSFHHIKSFSIYAFCNVWNTWSVR